jgi:hypothetical protein
VQRFNPQEHKPLFSSFSPDGIFDPERRYAKPVSLVLLFRLKNKVKDGFFRQNKHGTRLIGLHLLLPRKLKKQLIEEQKS